MIEQESSQAALDQARTELKVALIEELLGRARLQLTPLGRSAVSADSDLSRWTLARIPPEYLKANTLRGRMLLTLSNLSRIRRLRAFIAPKRRGKG